MVLRSPGISEKRSFGERLDWNLLRWFLVIVQEGSLSKAAAVLFVTQSAVSQALKRLEEQVGCKLLERRGQQFQLTHAGEVILNSANEIFGDIALLGRQLGNEDNQVVGQVSLMVVSRIYSSAYDEFLASFRKKFSLVNLEIVVSPSAHIISSLLRNTITAGFVVSRPVDKLTSIPFLQQRWGVFCGRHHRLFGRDDVDLGDLKTESFVSFTSEQLGDALSPLTMFRDEKGFVGKIVATSPSLEEIERLIFTGFGIGCLPNHIGADQVAAGRLWPLPPAEGVIDVPISLAWHSGRKMNRAEAVFIRSFSDFIDPIPFPDRLGKVWERKLASMSGFSAVPTGRHESS